MPTTWGQTSFKHADKEVQREFERKSTPVVTNKQIVGGSGDNPLLSNSTDSSDNSQYTIYHNGIAVNTIGRNRSINFIDLEKDTTNMKRIEFKVSASGDSSGEDALLEAYYENDRFYIERFFLTTINENAPTGYKYGISKYRDIKHNFNLSDMNKLIYSVYCVSEINHIPFVKIIDANTLRVYGNVINNIESMIPYRNTKLAMNRPELEFLNPKDDNPEFIIVIEVQSA